MTAIITYLAFDTSASVDVNITYLSFDTASTSQVDAKISFLAFDTAQPIEQSQQSYGGIGSIDYDHVKQWWDLIEESGAANNQIVINRQQLPSTIVKDDFQAIQASSYDAIHLFNPYSLYSDNIKHEKINNSLSTKTKKNDDEDALILLILGM